MHTTLALLSFVAVCVVVPTTLLLEVFLDPNSELRTRLWCRKHGLRHREWHGPECAIFWYGEDVDGRAYVPGGDGRPVEIRRGDYAAMGMEK